MVKVGHTGLEGSDLGLFGLIILLPPIPLSLNLTGLRLGFDNFLFGNGYLFLGLNKGWLYRSQGLGLRGLVK